MDAHQFVKQTAQKKPIFLCKLEAKATEEWMFAVTHRSLVGTPKLRSVLQQSSVGGERRERGMLWPVVVPLVRWRLVSG